MSEDTIYGSDVEIIRETSSVAGQVIMPFYLICDVSGSMHSDMGNLNTAVRELVDEIQNDPIVDDMVMLSIITFSSSAQVIVPLNTPSAITLPNLTSSGATNYSAAFKVYNDAFELDRARLKNEGRKVYRPCVFFLTDGAPTDSAYMSTFTSLFGYEPESHQGNRAFPYFVPFGFRDASEAIIRNLAYPDFGTARGRWFLSRTSKIGEILNAMAGMIGNTVISSGLSASGGQAQIVPPSVPSNSTMQFGDAGDLV